MKYKVIAQRQMNDFNRELNSLAEQGWVIVSAGYKNEDYRWWAILDKAADPVQG